MGVRAITFDFWRTLFRNVNGESRQLYRMEAFANAAGRTVDEVVPAFAQTWTTLDVEFFENNRTLSAHDAVRLTAQALDVSLDTATLDRLAHEFATAVLHFPPEPIEGALEAVRQAASRVPIGIISDTSISPGASLRQLLDRHGFLPHFQAVVFSDEIGRVKPDPETFRAAARGLGVEPRELLHIGDLEHTDIVGAHGIGALAAMFTADNPTHEQDSQADFVWRSWDEFVAFLPQCPFAGAGT